MFKNKDRSKSIAKLMSQLIVLDVNAPSLLRAMYGTQEDTRDYRAYLKRRQTLSIRVAILSRWCKVEP